MIKFYLINIKYFDSRIKSSKLSQSILKKISRYDNGAAINQANKNLIFGDCIILPFILVYCQFLKLFTTVEL